MDSRKLIRFTLTLESLTKEEIYKVLEQGIRMGASVIPRYRNDKVYNYLFKIYPIPLEVYAKYHRRKRLPFVYAYIGNKNYVIDAPKELEKEFIGRLNRVLIKMKKEPGILFYTENVKKDRDIKRLNLVFNYIRGIAMADNRVTRGIQDNETLKAYGDAMSLLHKEYKKAAREFSKTLADFIEPLMNEMEMLADAFKTTGKGDIFKKRHRSLVKAYNEMQRLLDNASKTKL